MNWGTSSSIVMATTVGSLTPWTISTRRIVGDIHIHLTPEAHAVPGDTPMPTTYSVAAQNEAARQSLQEALEERFEAQAKERFGDRLIIEKALQVKAGRVPPKDYPAFRDAVENGRSSKYWNWYEFHKWPLPSSRDFNASEYYDCWWGFGLHPNLNFDLSRANADENNVWNIEDAQPNMDLVNYVLKTADVWLGDLDIDGFRLDVPNEVPFWFWKLWRERCDSIKDDVWLVGDDGAAHFDGTAIAVETEQSHCGGLCL